MVRIHEQLPFSRESRGILGPPLGGVCGLGACQGVAFELTTVKCDSCKVVGQMLRFGKT